MSRTAIPFQTNDISSLAKALRAQLQARESLPGHVEFLNILARSAGWRNFQHLRSEAASLAEVEVAAPPLEEAVDPRRIERVRRCFSDDGRLLRWPAKRGDQVLALWVLWSKIPSKQDLSEAEVNTRLKALNDFSDHVLLRRELADGRFMTRTPDGRVYRRLEQRPPADAMRLIGQLQAGWTP